MVFASPNAVQTLDFIWTRKRAVLDFWTFGLFWTLFGLDKQLIINCLQRKVQKSRRFLLFWVGVVCIKNKKRLLLYVPPPPLPALAEWGWFCFLYCSAQVDFVGQACSCVQLVVGNADEFHAA